MEDPDFAKQNDRDSAARPLTDIPAKLLKQGIIALHGMLMFPILSGIVLPLGTRCGFRSTARWLRIMSRFNGWHANLVIADFLCYPSSVS